jgi:hypothetical protein
MVRWARSRRKETLVRLASIVSGEVKDGHLRGAHGGHEVEVWIVKQDPTPSGLSGEGSADEALIFNLRLGGVTGRGAWACRSTPTLNPLAGPTYEFDMSFGGLGAMSRFLGAIADVPAQDEGLEGRLRAAGVVEVLDRFGRGGSAFLPRAQYTPPLQSRFSPELAEAMLPRAAAVGGRGGELLCAVELRNDAEPDPARFGELLEFAHRLVEINAQANPPGA